MRHQPRTWNEWYQQFLNGDEVPLWNSVLKAVRCHRFSNEDINGEVAGDALMKFLKWTNRNDVIPYSLSDSHLEGMLQTIIANTFKDWFGQHLIEFKRLRQLAVNDIDSEGPRSGIVTFDEISWHSPAQVVTPEQSLLYAEIEREFREALTKRQHYINDNYKEITHSEADMTARDLMRELEISSATFFRDVERIRKVRVEVLATRIRTTPKRNTSAAKTHSHKR